VGLLQKKGWSDMDDVREYNRRYHKLDRVKRKRVLRNTVTKRENQRKEEKQKRKGERYSGGMGLNKDTTQSALNIGGVCPLEPVFFLTRGSYFLS
jgi:hypothetical protein